MNKHKILLLLSNVYEQEFVERGNNKTSEKIQMAMNNIILFKRMFLRMRKEILNEREIHIRLPNFYEVWIPRYLEEDFFKHFRMSRKTFASLLNNVEKVHNANKLNIKKHSGGIEEVPLEKSLLFSIWYLAKGDSIILTADRFDVSLSTLHKLLTMHLKHLVKLLPVYVQWPNEFQRAEIAEEFLLKGGFPDVMGAIDGCHISCKVPKEQHDSYVDRKLNHSINLQGICTASNIFIDVSIGWPGSIHDARVLKESFINSKILSNGKEHFLGEKYHLLGDSAYPCYDWLMTPYRTTANMQNEKKVYNTILSRTRVTIENTFGLLKGRWRILNYVNAYSIERVTLIAAACCVLHNFCIINNDSFENDETIDGTELTEINKSLSDNERIDKLEGLEKRKEITIFLNNKYV